MNWYYAEGSQQVGPVDQAQFDMLIASGRIRPDTLVWHSGLPSWAPYSSVAPAPPVVPQPVAYGAVQPSQGGYHAGGAAPQPAYSGASHYCAECGAPHPDSEMVRFGDSYVCAYCKDTFAQKLREGVRTTASYRYAGFWIRFLALFIDGILLGIVNIVLSAVVGAAMATGGNEFSAARLGMIGVLYLLQLAIGASYEAFFLVNYGATPGKMACGLRVVRASGAPITWGLGFGRYLAKLLSGFTFLIGYIIAAFDDQKRALHDRLCDTRVVYK